MRSTSGRDPVVELRRKAGAVPPPLSVLAPSLQPRRCCREVLVLLSSSEKAADC